jgi:hypothetical protein
MRCFPPSAECSTARTALPRVRYETASARTATVTHPGQTAANAATAASNSSRLPASTPTVSPSPATVTMMITARLPCSTTGARIGPTTGWRSLRHRA